ERPGEKRAEAAGLVLQLADPAHVLDALFDRLHVAVHHRRRRRDAETVRLAHDAEPFARLRLLRRDDLAHAVDEDLRAPARNRIEPGVAQARERLGNRQLRAARDVLHLRRRERVEMDLVLRLDRREEILVVVDSEVRMVAALHEQARPAEGERLLHLLEDDRLREEVSLARVARAPIERAEIAVGVADVRVVEVAIDDERDAIGVVLAIAHLVRDATDRDEVARPKQREGLVVVDALAVEGLLEDLVHATAAPVVCMKRSSGTTSSSPASRAISRNVYRPARSRGPKR